MRRFQSWRAASLRFCGELSFTREPVTIRHIRHRLAHFEEEFQTTQPSELAAPEYRDWLDRMRREYEPASVKRFHSDAVRLLRWMRHPLAEQVALIRIPVPEKAIQTYSDEELRLILGWVLTRHESDTDQRSAAYLAIIATSGMRASECCALRWEAWNPGELLFRLTQTKTRVGRWAAVAPMVAPAVEEWRARARSGWVVPSLVCRENHANGSAMRQELSRLRQRLGLPFLNSKAFRSTLVKRVIEAGGGYEGAAAVVGHSSIETTRRHYHRITMTAAAREAHAGAWEGFFND